MPQPTVSREEFESLEEEVREMKESIAILTNKELLRDIKEARKRRKENKGVPLSQVKEDLLE